MVTWKEVQLLVPPDYIPLLFQVLVTRLSGWCLAQCFRNTRFKVRWLWHRVVWCIFSIFSEQSTASK